MAFRQQVRPTFLEWHFLPRSLRRVLTASSADVHAEVLDFVLEHARRADADLRGDLEALVVNIRNTVVTAATEQVRDSALGPDGSLSAKLLRKLAADGDHDASNELGRRAVRGDLHAASAIGRADKLSEPAGQALLNDTVTECRKLIADAAAGGYSDGKDSARNLVVLNLAFPGLADWETVFDLLCDRRVAADAKLGAVTVLTDADSIPADAPTSIRERFIADGPQAISSILSLTTDPAVYQGQTYAFAVSVGAIGNDRAVQRVLSLLRGSTTQRRTACTVITALSRRAGDPLIQGALIMLTADPQHEVRAAAASALLRGVVPGVSAEVEQALLAAAYESGCAGPLQVARVLAGTPGGVRKREFLTGLLGRSPLRSCPPSGGAELRVTRTISLTVVPPSRRWAHTADEPGQDGLTPAGAPAATITITVAFVSADQGLVRVSDSFGVSRTRAGSILADDGTNYQVKWDDTDEEELVPRGTGVHVATRGSLRFLALSDSRLFHAVFAQEPLAVVLHLLAESSVPLKVREIRERLTELGLRNETWARHGPRALAVLPKWPNVVRRQKGDTLAYAWVGDDLPELPSEAEPDPEPAPTPAPLSKLAPSPAMPIAPAATPAEPAVPSAERLRRQMSAARSLGEVARLLTLPREFVAELSPEVVASALRRIAAEDRLVAGWLDALTASGPIGALIEELATAQAANAALQSRVDELEEWWTALEQSTDPGEAIRQPGS